MQMVLVETPVSPRILVKGTPVDLDTICQKCLEKEPSKRYASVSDLKDDLQRFLDQMPIMARPVGWIGKTTKWAKRNQAMTVLIGSACISIVGAIAGLAWHSQQLGQQLEQTQRLANSGSEFSNWVIGEHLESLARISGTTKIRKQVAEHAKDHLHSISEELPDDAQFLYRLARSYSHLGSTIAVGQNTTGETDKGREYFVTAIELFDKALELDSSLKPQLQLEKVDTMMSLAHVYNELNQPENHLKTSRAASKLFEALDGSEFPNRVRHMQIQQIRNGYREHATNNDFEAARDSLNELEKLLTEFETTDYDRESLRFHRIWQLSEQTNQFQYRGEVENAIEAMAELLELSGKAYEESPFNPVVATSHAGNISNYAHLLAVQNEHEKSLEQLNEALEIYRDVADRNRDGIEAQANLAQGYARLSDWYFRNSQDIKSEQRIDKAVAIFRNFSEQTLATRWYLQTFAIHLQSQAMIRAALRKPKQALESYQEVSQILEKLDKLEPNSIFVLNQVAESNWFKSELLVDFWVEQESSEKPSQNQHYLEMLAGLDRSLEMYAKIEELSELSSDQRAIRDKVIEFRSFVKGQAEKLDAIFDSSAAKAIDQIE